VSLLALPTAAIDPDPSAQSEVQCDANSAAPCAAGRVDCVRERLSVVRWAGAVARAPFPRAGPTGSARGWEMTPARRRTARNRRSTQPCGRTAGRAPRRGACRRAHRPAAAGWSRWCRCRRPARCACAASRRRGRRRRPPRWRAAHRAASARPACWAAIHRAIHLLDSCTENRPMPESPAPHFAGGLVDLQGAMFSFSFTTHSSPRKKA
jgi:hypothetical protein